MINNEATKDVVWTIEDLKRLKQFYEKEYERTQNTSFQLKLEEIHKYLSDYEHILEHLGSSIELRLYKYINNGLSVTKAVEKVAEENYLQDKKPVSTSKIWLYYKNLKKIIENYKKESE